MRESISISISPELKKRLDLTSGEGRMNRSDIVREALDEYFARKEFESIRNKMIPLAESKGIFTDDDVFGEVS
ncbi:MAG: ribbon-helix-helix protein, CopG family [Actinobacteria bacterium]|nr:ribbon-helix-helix protein, CopG family [Actinomycetota bacterium]